MKQKYKRIDIKTKRLVNSLFLWNYKAAFKWRGLEFSDFREYTSSDDAKHIDWLVSAREWKTIMRRYREERELDILFLIDLSDSMQFGLEQKKTDTLMEILYLIAFSGIQNGDKVWALLFGWEKDKRVPFKKWNIGLHYIIDAVDWYIWWKTHSKLDLKNMNTLAVKNSLIFILTDKIQVDEKSLKLARIKNDIIFINIFDTFENTLEWKKWIFTFRGKNKELNLDMANQKKKKQYTSLRIKKKQAFEKTLSQNKVSYLEINEKTDIYKAFLSFMKTREL